MHNDLNNEIKHCTSLRLLRAQKYDGKDKLLMTTEALVVEFKVDMQNLKDVLQLERSGQ